jgi:SPP1 family predicted phage head-tail adaptor
VKRINGNISATLQKRAGSVKNEIGESIPKWETVHTLKGFIDLSSGDARRTTYHAKIQESTHMFICDYVEIDSSITAENSRMIINGRIYDVTYIDNPMELNKHLEIYLTFTGGQNG